MDGSAVKLARKYTLPLDLAQALVDAGYRNPVKIEKATETDLQKVKGIGPATAAKLKSK